MFFVLMQNTFQPLSYNAVQSTERQVVLLYCRIKSHSIHVFVLRQMAQGAKFAHLLTINKSHHFCPKSSEQALSFSPVFVAVLTSGHELRVMSKHALHQVQAEKW